jgi:hypothetical protein
MFTKQHYERVAATLAETRYGPAKASESKLTAFAVNKTRAYIAEEIADMFADDNQRFNRTAFYKAAGVFNHITPGVDTGH